MKVRVRTLWARLRAPLVAAHGSVAERELVLLELEGADGARGCGEGAPLRSYDGVDGAEVIGALERCRGLLESSDGREHARLLSACRTLAPSPPALAAIDLALWDLAGRRAGQPVWRLLGARAAEPVQVNATISSQDRAGAAREAEQAREAGCACVKVKVGIGDDAGRLAAVRAASGPGMAIRIDANGAWSVTEAVAALRALEPVGIALCEEPVHGLAEVRRVSDAVGMAVAIDESARLPGALARRVCDAVCLKVSSCGGISGLLRAAASARAVGYQVYLASTLDGPLGIAAALHAAAVLRPELPCGLATLPMFAGRPDGLPVRDGEIVPPRGPGLGHGPPGWYAAG